jgi:hypothetical protein
MVGAKCAEVAAHIDDLNIGNINQRPGPGSSQFVRGNCWTASNQVAPRTKWVGQVRFLRGWRFSDHPSPHSRLSFNLNPHPLKPTKGAAPTDLTGFR